MRIQVPHLPNEEDMVRYLLLNCRNPAHLDAEYRDGRVIVLRGPMLQTSLPDVCQLMHLEHLDLGHPFTGISYVCPDALQALPAEIGQLSHLRFLDVHRNALKELPQEIGHLRNLRELRLQGNEQFATLPQEIGLLGVLEYLDLRHTALQKIPGELWSLASLKSLCLGGTALTHLSPEIGQLTHLEVLDVSATTLTTFPATLATLPKLKKLVINKAQAQALDSPRNALKLSRQVSLSICTVDSWIDHLCSIMEGIYFD